MCVVEKFKFACYSIQINKKNQQILRSTKALLIFGNFINLSFIKSEAQQTDKPEINYLLVNNGVGKTTDISDVIIYWDHL